MNNSSLKKNGDKSFISSKKDEDEDDNDNDGGESDQELANVKWLKISDQAMIDKYGKTALTTWQADQAAEELEAKKKFYQRKKKVVKKLDTEYSVQEVEEID